MNVYDFDKTIYQGDSSLDFFFFSLRRHPAIVRRLPQMLRAALAYKKGSIDKTHVKEAFFVFLADIAKTQNIEQELEIFWQKHIRKIAPWYLQMKRSDDLVISASPEFLVAGALKHLGLSHLIASRVQSATGHFLTPNCRGQEKLKRYRSEFGYTPIENFYSDAYFADAALAQVAQHAWLVYKNTIQPWPACENNSLKHDKIYRAAQHDKGNSHGTPRP